MKVGIIGAGFTGLSAAYSLAKHGHHVTIIEKDSAPGGLALGYQEKKWEWTLERHYHHWFTNDYFMLSLAKEINHEVIILRAHTNWYVNGKIYEFDSIKSALTFTPLSFINRLRNLLTLGLLRIDPFWQPLEKVNASTFLPKVMGRKTYQLFLEPLLINKFGKFADNVSLAWFWARIKKRTPNLAYPKGGFLEFADHLVKVIAKKGGKIYFNCELLELTDSKKAKIVVKTAQGKKAFFEFDKVIVTLPSFLFVKTTPQLPDSYKNGLAKLNSLGATNLVLRLKKPFFQDQTYWLSIADKTSPIMAIVEHTNFMDKKYYNNEHIVYLGNYLPSDSPLYLLSKKEKLKLFHPYLRKINPKYKKNLIGYQLFKAPFAQPVIPTNYSKLIPPFTTPLKNVFLANIDQVYPWDRGTNYAVELGKKIATFIED